jgi:hypothetical protein
MYPWTIELPIHLWGYACPYLEGLVHLLGLPIAFWMMSGGEVESDVEGFAKGAEEMRDELQTSVRGNVQWNSMLGEYVEEEELCELQRRYCVICGDEYALFWKMINDNKDESKSRGCRELLYEVDWDGVSGFLRDRELLE